MAATHMAPAMALAAAALAMPAVGRELSATAAAALPRDDVCAEPSACGLSALQIARQRHSWDIEEEGTQPGHLEGKSFTPTGLAEHRSDPWALNDTEMKMVMMVPDWFPNATERKVDMFWDGMSSADATICNELPFSQMWTTYFWPQMAFWVKEIMRRKDTVDMADTERFKKFQKFAFQAAYLGSILHMDPRKGAPWEADVKPFFKEVASRASTDYEMPQIPDFMRRTSMREYVWGMDVNMWWYTNLWCDIDHHRKRLLGDKVIPEGEVCWDEVPFPGVAFSIFTNYPEPDLPPWGPDFDPYNYPEYLHCQQHNIDQRMLDELTPFAGHVKNGVDDSFWGTGPTGPDSKEVKESIVQCQKGFGDLIYTKLNIGGTRYIGDGLGLGQPIDDGKSPDPPREEFDPEVFRRSMADMFNTSYFRTMRESVGIPADFNPFNMPMASPFFQAVHVDYEKGETRQQAYVTAAAQLMTRMAQIAERDAKAEMQAAIQSVISKLAPWTRFSR